MNEVNIPTGPQVVNPSAQAKVEPALPKVEIKPIIITPNAKPIPRPQPADWWSLNEQGLRPAVVTKVQASTIPDAWKTAIITDINSLAPEFNFVSVHAGCQVDKGKSNKHFTLTGKTVLA